MTSQRLKVVLPLAFGLLLLGVFAVLLVEQVRRIGSGTAHDQELAAQRGKELLDAPEPVAGPPAIPTGSPTDPDPYRPRPRPRFEGTEFFRWNLKDLPEGWDPAIAKRIHELFKLMEFTSLDDSDTILRVEKAREELAQYLASLGPEALPTLEAILNAEPDFVARRFILRAVGDLGPESEEATFVLRDYFLKRKDDPANLSEVLKVAEAMGRLKNKTSLEVLDEFIHRPDMSRFRPKLIEALGEHPRSAELLGTFVEVMTEDPNFQARNKAAQALGKVRSPEALPDLMHAYRNERVWYARQTMLGTIGKIGDPAAVPFLETEARGARESGVRLSAAAALRRIGTPRALAVLRELARTEPDPQVRRHIERWAFGEP